MELQVQLHNHPLNQQLQSQVKEKQQECRAKALAKEKFLQQKAKMNWLNLGDQNTQFFHMAIQKKHYRSRVLSLKDGDTLITEYDDVVEHFVQFSKNLLGAQSEVRKTELEIYEQGPDCGATNELDQTS